MIKKLVSILLIFTLLISTTVNVFASEENSVVENKMKELGISNYSQEIQTYDGNSYEISTFLEKGVSKKVIKKIKTDGNCDIFVYENGELTNHIQNFFPARKSARITYPYYTDYWYAGTDEYSTKTNNAGIAAMAGVIAAGCGIPWDGAINIASMAYSILDYFTEDYVYYKTKRYYATLEYGPGQPTIYYTRFITTTYSDSNRTKQIGSAITEEYEGINPL